MRKKLFQHKSILNRYVVFYVSLALFSCSLAGLVLFYVSVNELNNAAQQEQQHKLALSCRYVQSQLDAMQDVAYRISFEYKFRPDYLRQHRYHERQAVEALRQYVNYTPLSDDYFLLYPEFSYVFKPGATNTMDVYMSQFGIVRYRMLETAIRRVDRFQVFTSEENGNVAFFAFPIRFSNSEETVTICFAVHLTKLLSTVESYVGEFPGGLSIEIDGVSVTPQNANGSTLTERQGEVICSLLEPVGAQYKGIADFGRLIIGLMIAIIVIVLTVALALSWRSYQPIRKLVRESEHFFIGASGSQNEFQRISETLNAVYARNAHSTTQLHDEMIRLEQQRAVIRAQLVRLILCGRAQEPVEEQLKYLDIHFPRPWFAVAVISVRKNTECVDDLMEMTGQLSSGDVCLFPERLYGESGFAVLIAASEETGIHSAMELVYALLDAEGVERRVTLSAATEHIADVPQAFMSAMTDICRKDGSNAAECSLRYSDVALPARSNSALKTMKPGAAFTHASQAC